MGAGHHRMPFFQKLSQTQREAFTAHSTAQLMSQFLHGEQGAVMTAACVTHSVPDINAKLYAATQTMDEARHVEVTESSFSIRRRNGCSGSMWTKLSGNRFRS